MTLGVQDVHPLHHLLISLVLGLLVGLQRQWADAPLAGIRTFALISLFGTVCALLAETFGQWIVVVGFLGVGIAIFAGHLTKKFDHALTEHSGLVTEFAMFLMYSAGVLVRVGPVWLAAAIAGILAVTLQAKIELHGIAKRFSGIEISAIMQFVLLSLVIFPNVPNRTFGPLDVFNPHDVWLMVVIIVAISLAGYISYKFFGEKAGILVGGILGGVISSTATTVTHAKMNHESRTKRWPCILVILIAWAIVYIRLFVEVLLAAPNFHEIWLPLAIMFIVSIVPIMWIWRKADHHRGMPVQSNPTELRTALTFGALYTIILFAVALAKQEAGTTGLYFVSFLSGITDMDAITLSTARLVHTGKVVPSEGWRIIVIAIVSNTLFKGLILRFWGGRNLFRDILIPWSVSIATGISLLVIL